MLRKILLVLIALLLIIQFIPVNRDVEPSPVQNDFLQKFKPEPELAQLIRTACYDCHSNETKYPWYAYVAPVSLYLQHHIDEGRAELNFSNWGTYTLRRADHKLEECVELIDEGEMPLSNYVFMHQEAKLSNEQRARLAAYFSSLR